MKNIPIHLSKFEKVHEKYLPWKAIGIHTIIRAFSHKNIYAICGWCGLDIKTNITSLKKSNWCKSCIRQKYKVYEYLYWISKERIWNRINKWWTLPEAIWLIPRILWNPESKFTDRDLLYISKISNKTYQEFKILENNTNEKYFHKKINFESWKNPQSKN